MNVLDVILILLVLAYALSGYWQGFITGAFATAGLLLGGLFGIWLAPIALGDAEPSTWVSLGALFIVILSATLGQASLQLAGAKARELITWQPARALDAVGGALLSAFAVLLVAWALGVAVSGSKIGSVTPVVRESTVLAKVDAALPDQAYTALNSFNSVVGTGFFPRYLEPFAPERIVEVEAPDTRRIMRDPDVRGARQAVIKVRGENNCGRGVEGSGFFYAPGRVMTNAHVVAGVDDPQVHLGEDTFDADVVLYDPDLDIAVLSVSGAGVEPLVFSQESAKGANVAVLGFPEDGPYDVQPGRVRTEQKLRSPNIYNEGSVIREVLSLRALIRPGNSGGPVINTDGDVVGVVFAASVTDSETGYAVTSKAVQGAASTGRAARTPVSTGTCTS
ncbi:MarP family serine protease [Nocardioides dubius]|uniref:Acid resistance serine protease MarP n=1 Tax=Nocardioides dubius TaxID=317019 RepID=A0ABN1U1H8_9ACTN